MVKTMKLKILIKIIILKIITKIIKTIKKNIKKNNKSCWKDSTQRRDKACYQRKL